MLLLRDPEASDVAVQGLRIDAFLLHDGVVLSGSRAWGPSTGQGTSKDREQPLVLSGTHRLQWRDYFRLPGPGGEFKALVVPVEQ